MPDQETYGRFTPGAWNLIKSVNFTEEEKEELRLMIESKTETITKKDAISMIYAIVRDTKK